MTYLFDIYGDLEAQKRLFEQAKIEGGPSNQYIVRYEDEYFPWLEERLDRLDVPRRITCYGIPKPFRTEAAEVYFMALALAPIQVVHNLPLLVFGNEKSADRGNIVHEGTGQEVNHQWTKSFAGEIALSELYRNLFVGLDRMSLTKALYDVRIFETLFRIGGELPYATNSCNIKKPWCGRCEKCTYVFAGFSAFGDHKKTVDAFGMDCFSMEDNRRLWEELLGLHGYTPWECVGHPEEVQLYAHMLKQKGVKGILVDLFNEHFSDLSEETLRTNSASYGHVYTDHHRMPDWLFDRLVSTMSGPAVL